MDFVERCGPKKIGIVCLYVDHYVETVKYLDFNLYVQLSRWSRGNASDWGSRGPGFDAQL